MCLHFWNQKITNFIYPRWLVYVHKLVWEPPPPTFIYQTLFLFFFFSVYGTALVKFYKQAKSSCSSSAMMLLLLKDNQDNFELQLSIFQISNLFNLILAFN